MRTTDDFTKNALVKLNRYYTFRDYYERKVQNAMLKNAGKIPDSWKLKCAKLEYKDKILLRIGRGIITTKRAIRNHEKENGLNPVCLDIFDKDFGYRKEM